MKNQNINLNEEPKYRSKWITKIMIKMDFQNKELNGELYDKNIDIVELQNKYLIPFMMHLVTRCQYLLNIQIKC